MTATDLTLTVVQMLRKKGVVEKFVEFFGAGLQPDQWIVPAGVHMLREGEKVRAVDYRRYRYL